LDPIFVSDIDGTLAQYHEHLAWFASMYWDLPLASLQGYDGNGPINEWYGVGIEEYRRMKLAFRSGGMKRFMPAYNGARALMTTARDFKCEIWLATTRPYLRLDSIDPDTRHWLSREGIAYNHLLFGERKYDDLCEQIDSDRVVMVLEDLPELYDQAANNGLPVVQIERTHNRHFNSRRAVSAGTLYEASQALINRVNQWKEKYGIEHGS